MNRFTVVVIALLAAFGGVFWVTKNEKKADAPSSGQAVQASSHTQGEGNKGVTLTEYGDFECPACGQYYPILKELKNKFGDDLKFQFRHFPLVQIHPNAMAAHKAAEAAGKQGKFFEMHDKIYEQQQVWSGQPSVGPLFESFATELGLNMEQYKKDVASAEVNSIINADTRAGQEAGVSSTPTFVLNGQKIEKNPRDLDEFVKLIEEEIAKQSE